MAEVPKLKPMKEEFIRGSDMVSLMKGNWLDLYQIKKGLVGRDDLSNMFNVQLGTFTETFNMIWAEKIYNLSFVPQYKSEKMYGSIKLQGTLDGIAKSTATNYDIAIECKHTHSMNTMENMLNYYMPQMQFYCYISGIKRMILSVIFGNKWEAVEVGAAKEYQEMLLQQIKMFWQYIVHDKEPDVSVKSVINTKPIQNKVKVNGMTKRDVSKSNSFTSACNDYLLHEDTAKLFEKAKKELKAELKENESEIYNDKLSVKRDKRGSVRITKKG